MKKQCIMFPTALMITPHCHPAFPYVDMTVPHKQYQEHRPRHSHATCCTQM